MKKSTTIRVAICDTTGEVHIVSGMSKKKFHAYLSNVREKGQEWRFSLTSFEKKYLQTP